MQYNKVEICGVNTNKLKVLSEEEKLRLLRESKSGDKRAREELIKGNLRLVLSVIQRFVGRGENPDDLFQVGCIGLIKAIDNFDIDLNCRFSTYAVPMIIGELRRYMRDNNAVRVSRSIRDTAYRAMQVREALINELGREPKPEEIARQLGIAKSAVVIALEAVSEPLSLYDPVYSDGSDTVYVMDQLGDNDSEQDWIDEISFRQAIDKLSAREKRILGLRFLLGKTQTEVAGELGISQAQVSRLEKAVLDRIKDS